MEPKKSRKGLWAIAIALLVLALLILCGGIASLAGDAAKDDAAIVVPTEVPATSPSPESTAELDAEMQKALGELDKQLSPSPSATPKRSQDPDPRIDGDDLVHVGEDIPAGTYRAVERISGDGPFDICYWSKSSDAEGSKIIDNGLPTGGRPQVTLKRGQWFKSQGCPDWRKQ
jgi:hypothetical protein